MGARLTRAGGDLPAVCRDVSLAFVRPTEDELHASKQRPGDRVGQQGILAGEGEPLRAWRSSIPCTSDVSDETKSRQCCMVSFGPAGTALET